MVYVRCLIGIILASSVFFGGCGLNLDGTWQTGCILKSDGNYLTASYAFSGQGYVSTGTVFSDSACSSKISTTTTTATFTLGNDVSGLEKTKEFDLTPSSVTLAVHTSAGVTSNNTNSCGGFTNWAADVAQEVAGATCSGVTFLSTNTAYYDIVKVDDNSLQFGSSQSPATVSSSRATALETGLTYTLQQ